MRPHPRFSDGSAQPPDDETYCTAMIVANRAPSIHNSQPWQWGVGSSRVQQVTRTTYMPTPSI